MSSSTLDSNLVPKPTTTLLMTAGSSTEPTRLANFKTTWMDSFPSLSSAGNVKIPKQKSISKMVKSRSIARPVVTKPTWICA